MKLEDFFPSSLKKLINLWEYWSFVIKGTLQDLKKISSTKVVFLKRYAVKKFWSEGQDNKEQYVKILSKRKWSSAEERKGCYMYLDGRITEESVEPQSDYEKSNEQTTPRSMK